MRVSLLCLKRNNSQTFKSTGCRKLFSSVHVTGVTCIYNLLYIQLAAMIVFIPCNYWMTLFFTNVYCSFLVFLNRHNVAIFETSVLNKVHILRYLHTKFQN